MAITTCRECGQSVSDQAEQCPHCGINTPCADKYGDLVISAMAEKIADDMVKKDEREALLKRAAVWFIVFVIFLIALFSGTLSRMLKFFLT